MAEGGLFVEVSQDDPWREVSGYFCTWEHAASWCTAGESGKAFDVVFPEMESLTRRERVRSVVEPVGVFALFIWACALMLIGAWTAATWIFPIHD